MKIVILGASGMLGHMVSYYFKKKHENVILCSRSKTGSDWLDESLTRIPDYSKKNILALIQKHRPCKVVNCVGVTKFKENVEEGYLINSGLPVLLSEILDKNNDGSQLIQISTNDVFSGNRGNYVESDIPDATDPYGQSKLKGEVIRPPHLTIRTSIIGTVVKPNLGTKTKSKTGLLEWFLNQERQASGYTKVKWNGVTTLEYAKFIDWAINRKINGLIHFFSNIISKYDLLEIAKDVFDKNTEIIPDDTIQSHKTLDTQRSDLNYIVQNHREMLLELKKISLN